MVEVGSAVKLSVSGYRARVGEGFTPESCLRFANAFAAFLAQSGGRTVVLGRDTRPSGLAAFHAVLSGLLASGLSVHDAQVAPTPTVFYAAARLEADGALMITASHNPPDWNGIEAASRSGRLLNGSEREQLHRLFYAQSAAYTRWDEQGVCSPLPHAVDQHLEAILELPFVDLEAVRGAGFRVVVDAGNGAGAVSTPRLLRRLGCDVVPLHCELNGRFARPLEPSPEALQPLAQAVLETGAQLGLAHDGDADRLVLVDEKGRYVPEEYTFALVADVILERFRGPVVTTVVTGGLLDAVAQSHGVPIYRTPVGVAHVAQRMEETGAVVGGESTGGVIVPQLQRTTDGIAAAAVILSGMVRRGEPLSEWVGRWPRFWMRRAKLPLPEGFSVERVYQTVAELYPGAAVERIDGLKLLLDERAWVSVRPSGTEPVVRVFAEADDPARADELVRRTAQAVRRVLDSTV